MNMSTKKHTKILRDNFYGITKTFLESHAGLTFNYEQEFCLIGTLQKYVEEGWKKQLVHIYEQEDRIDGFIRAYGVKEYLKDKKLVSKSVALRIYIEIIQHDVDNVKLSSKFKEKYYMIINYILVKILVVSQSS